MASAVAAVGSHSAAEAVARMDSQQQQQQTDDAHAAAAAQQHERELERQRKVRAAFEAKDSNRAPLTLSERVWVGATLSLILFLVLTSQLLMVLYWRHTPTFSLTELVYVLAPFNVVCGLLLYNYKLAALRSPGRVPRGWTPLVPLASQHDAEATEPVEVKRSGAPRWCKVCRAPKPPRAHHCRQCARCTLRMDHHCPWLANCVGHHNYAAFIRFLAAVDVACAFHVVMLSARVADWWGPGYWRQPTTPVMVLLVLNFVFCIPVLILVGLFSLYHFYCAMCNSTTIEGWEKDRVATMVRRGRVRDIQYPYDLGPIRNLQAVLGPNPLLWCWPQATPGDGLHYALRKGAEWEECGRAWDPRHAETMRRWAQESLEVEPAEESDAAWGQSSASARGAGAGANAWDALLRVQGRPKATREEVQPLV